MNRRLPLVVLALGIYLSLRGYHSRDGDQAFRLPLLLARQDTSAFRDDPFVRAFDVFNPHCGYLAVLDVVSRGVGLSATLLILFVFTFGITVLAVDRIARDAAPSSGSGVGVWAVALVLIAKAGNLGTNHLFEAMLLDRLIALALGWAAVAAILSDLRNGPKWAALAIGAAAVVHPSLGLQLGLIVMSWLAVIGGWRGTIGAAWIGLGIAPGVLIAASQSGRLMDGLAETDFLTIAASIQGPQHMLPHLWRMPQWLAGASYLALAGLTVTTRPRSPVRDRLLALLGIVLAALAAGWFGIEVLQSAKVTLFQPFRMATVARGLSLIVGADLVASRWDRGDGLGRVRALVLVAGVASDWLMVVAVGCELLIALSPRWERMTAIVGWLVGAAFLASHDTEGGHWILIAAALAPFAVAPLGRLRRAANVSADDPRQKCRYAVACTAVWMIPVAAAIFPNFSDGPIAKRLAEHCRFGEWAGDDVERLAAWCRVHTPERARFVGPPGPKTFRLWARRDLAFNRAASPYHAAGLADWIARFRDHVGFRGSIAEFAAMYLSERQKLEAGFDAMDAQSLAELARRENADHVFASSKLRGGPALERLHVEGRYAAFRVRTVE